MRTEPRNFGHRLQPQSQEKQVSTMFFANIDTLKKRDCYDLASNLTERLRNKKNELPKLLIESCHLLFLPLSELYNKELQIGRHQAAFIFKETPASEQDIINTLPLSLKLGPIEAKIIQAQLETLFLCQRFKTISKGLAYLEQNEIEIKTDPLANINIIFEPENDLLQFTLPSISSGLDFWLITYLWRKAMNGASYNPKITGAAIEANIHLHFHDINDFLFLFYNTEQLNLDKKDKDKLQKHIDQAAALLEISLAQANDAYGLNLAYPKTHLPIRLNVN
ncbi:MAG: hypothetical protein PHH14_06410 [Candidatus Margulisbacteria bacterium]|nr:hypothetical protein [Candidatus Margulisiibacteriota bacterium]